MALRLAGEEFSVVQGLDSQGWLREVKVAGADWGLEIIQDGTGGALGLRQKGSGYIFGAFGGADGQSLAMIIWANQTSQFYKDVILNEKLKSGSDRDLRLVPGTSGYRIDAQAAIYNSQAVNSGDVLIDDDMAVSAGKKIRLEGAGSDTYFEYDTVNNRINVYLNGVLEGYIDTTGFVST